MLWSDRRPNVRGESSVSIFDTASSNPAVSCSRYDRGAIASDDLLPGCFVEGWIEILLLPLGD